MDALSIIGRSTPYFEEDYAKYSQEITNALADATVLIVGAAGSIGGALASLIARYPLKKLLLVDISENNLVEVVRQLKSDDRTHKACFETYCIDAGGAEFARLMSKTAKIDFIFNLSAMKHVRSEGNFYSLARLIQTNVINAKLILDHAPIDRDTKYFCVSTDKATNPINAMGASKLLMEKVLQSYMVSCHINFARFANVLFSDGSLPFGFLRRLEEGQPLSLPLNINRYFITKGESAKLCLLAALFAGNGEICFPNPSGGLRETSFKDLAEMLLRSRGFSARYFDDEEEARACAKKMSSGGSEWPVHCFVSDTSGEKSIEEFFEADDVVYTSRFSEIGILKKYDSDKSIINLDEFLVDYQRIVTDEGAMTSALIGLISKYVPEFMHFETGRNLNERM